MFLILLVNFVHFVLVSSNSKIFSLPGISLRNVSEIVQLIPKDVLQIELSFNKITRIYAKDFEQFTHCQKLDLRGNQIRSLDEEAFKGLDSLKELNLMGNKITSFPNLTDIYMLTTISLQNNKIIGSLPSVVHVSRYNVLEKIILHGNNINSVHAAFLQHFPKLSYLSIDNHFNISEDANVPSNTVVSRNRRQSDSTIPGLNDTLVEEAESGHPKGLLIFIGMLITLVAAILVLTIYYFYKEFKIIAPKRKPQQALETDVNPIYDGKLNLDGILHKETDYNNTRRLPALPPDENTVPKTVASENTIPKTIAVEMEEINLHDSDITTPKVIDTDIHTRATDRASNYCTSIRETEM